MDAMVGEIIDEQERSAELGVDMLGVLFLVFLKPLDP